MQNVSGNGFVNLILRTTCCLAVLQKNSCHMGADVVNCQLKTPGCRVLCNAARTIFTKTTSSQCTLHTKWASYPAAICLKTWTAKKLRTIPWPSCKTSSVKGLVRKNHSGVDCQWFLDLTHPQRMIEARKLHGNANVDQYILTNQLLRRYLMNSWPCNWTGVCLERLGVFNQWHAAFPTWMSKDASLWFPVQMVQYVIFNYVPLLQQSVTTLILANKS